MSKKVSKTVSKAANKGKRVLRAKKATAVSTSQKIRDCLAKGLPIPQIAKKLGITTNFVNVVRKNADKRSAKNLGLSLREYQYEKALRENLTSQVPATSKKMRTWALRNPWFGTDPEKTARALHVHEKLVEMGIDANSDKYIEMVDLCMNDDTYQPWNDPKPDTVNHPPHYKVGGIETIEFIEAKNLNFYLANVVKYVSRAGQKYNSSEVEDLRKAQWYLGRYISRLENPNTVN